MTPRSPRLTRWMLVLCAWILALFATVPSMAYAEPPTEEAPVATVPHDAPLVMQPSKIAIPPIPAGFEQRDIGWMRIAYPSSVRERVEPIVREAETFRTKLAGEFGQTVLEHVDVRVGRNPEEMATLAPLEVPPPAYATGVAYPSLDLVVLSLQAPGTYEAPELDEVFRHELSHIAIEDAVAGHHVPRWFNEGLAVYQSGEGQYARTRVLWDATLSRTVLPLAEIDRNFPANKYDVNIAYAESADFVRFLLRNSDRARFAALISRVRGGQAFDRALTDAYGTDLRKLEYEWREELDKRFSMLPMLTGGSLIWVLLVGLLVVAYWRRRKQAKLKLLQWEREEALADALARAAVAERASALSPESVETAGPPPPVVRTAVPVVEHDGTWHTLH